MHLSLPHFWGSWVPTCSNQSWDAPPCARDLRDITAMAYDGGWFQVKFQDHLVPLEVSTVRHVELEKKWRYNMKKNIKALLTRHFIHGMLVDLCVCLKIVYPETQWLMIIIPIKWLFHWEYTQHFQTNPFVRHVPLLPPGS